jgi:hypothetical protein
MNVLEPEVIVNDPVPIDTEADMLPVAIKFPPPLPPFIAYEAVKAYEEVPNSEPVIPCVTISDPLNIAGPMFVNVDEPDTVNDPVITALPLYGNGETYPVK